MTEKRDTGREETWDEEMHIHPSREDDGLVFYWIVPGDGTGALNMGTIEQVRDLWQRLTRLLDAGEHEGFIPSDHWQIAQAMSTVTEMEFKFGVPARTIQRACEVGDIKNARKVGRAWTFNFSAFCRWMNERKSPPQEDESPMDFSSSGLGIGGLAHHVEEPAVPTLKQLERLEKEKERHVKCACGHSVLPALVMSTSNGSSCPDCYDRMEDCF